MDVWLRAGVIIFSCILGSGGLWSYLEKRDKRKLATTQLLMGFAYSQITSLGTTYLRRGSITLDEYEEYLKYFFEPYQELGGNGTAARMMEQVARLPFRSHDENAEVFGNHEPRIIHNVPVIASSQQELSSGRQ